MKKAILGCLIVLGLFALPVWADLTKQDIEEIRKIVREEVQREIQGVQKDIQGMQKDIQGVQKDIQGMQKDIQGMQKDIQGMQKDIQGLQKEIQYVNQRIDDLRTLLYVILAGMFALVGFVLWDRRTALAPAAVRKIEGIERALQEFAKEEPRLATVLRQVGLL